MKLKEIHNNKEHCNALFQLLFKDYKNAKIDSITDEENVEFIRIVGDSEFVKDLVLFIHYNGYIEYGVSRWIPEDLYWDFDYESFNMFEVVDFIRQLGYETF